MQVTCGIRILEVEDVIQGAIVPVYLLYPAQAPEQRNSFGPYSIEAAPDAIPTGSNLPLVLLSHGNGGTPWGYSDLAKHLALASFVVALVKHPGNSRNDNALAGSIANLENRPRHLILAMGVSFADAVVGGVIFTQPIGIIGHSAGAYTALAVAGGEPVSAPHQSADGISRALRVPHDARVGALVLLMPAAFWYRDGSLQNVETPILLRAGELDTITPPPVHAEIILEGVPNASAVEYKIIPGAGHFSAMSRFPASMERPDFPPSQDPPGFDRVAYQPTLFADVEGFLRRHLC